MKISVLKTGDNEAKGNIVLDLGEWSISIINGRGAYSDDGEMSITEYEWGVESNLCEVLVTHASTGATLTGIFADEMTDQPHIGWINTEMLARIIERVGKTQVVHEGDSEMVIVVDPSRPAIKVKF